MIIIEAVVYSRERLSKKLQICIDLMSGKSIVSLDELVYLIQIIKGRDQSVEKKLQAIFQSKRIEEPVPKRLAY